MRMLFRTFSAFESPDVWKRAKYDEQGRRIYTLDDLGKQIIYSDKIRYNSRCKLGFDAYDERILSRELGWKQLFMDCAKFARDYFEIGFVTFLRDGGGSSIMTENAYLNAYDKIKSPNSFYIFFNARPTHVSNDKNVVTVGYDQYAFERDQNSVVVWNLDRFAFLNNSDITLWGIRHDTNQNNSVTGDEMVGIRGERTIYAIH
jgi:hypothetical protein